MIHVENIAQVQDFTSVAEDFSQLLVTPDNVDITKEFPGIIDRYANGDLDKVVDRLETVASNCEPGNCQYFIAFAGERAVGLSIVKVSTSVAEDVKDIADLSTPNLSSFVCNPYRGQGIGRLALRTRLQVVREQFGGQAWTRVEKTNAASNKIVTDAGLMPIGETETAFVYAYNAHQAQPA